MHQPNVAILGFGYLGRPLAERLYQQGSRMVALKRSLTSDDINLPIELQTADFNQHAAYGEWCGEHWATKDVWVCLLPPSPFPAYEACLKVWLDLARQYRVQHVVYASSISVYGDEARCCNEETEVAPATESARKVLAAEQVFLNSGLRNIDILRLGGLYSSSRHPLYRLQGRHNLPHGNRPVNMLHQDRAVAALLAAIHQPAGIRIRNVVETEHPGRRDFYATEAAKLGVPPPMFAEEEGGGGKIVTTLFRDWEPG